MVRVRAVLPIAVLTLALVFSSPFAVADPNGGDAPNDLAGAVDLGAGNFNGTLGDGDNGDWYRVQVPAAYTIIVDLQLVFGPHVHIILQNETNPQESSFKHLGPPDCCYEPGTWVGASQSMAFPAGGPALVGVMLIEPNATFDYQFNIRFVQPSDLAVTSVNVEPVPLETDAGATPVGIQRRITVTVDNLLPTGMDGAGLNVQARTPTDGRWHNVGGEGFQVTPGGHWEFTIDWITTGYFGDVEIFANVGSGLDVDNSNNDGTARTFVGVGGTGYGVSPLARDNGNLGLDLCRGLPDGVLNACTNAGTNPGGVDAWADVGTQQGGANVGVFYNPLNGGGNVNACTYGPAGGNCTNQQLP